MIDIIKKIFRFFAITALTLSAISQPADADWQYTRWGMSFSELQSIQGVSKNENNDKHTENTSALLRSDYVASGIKSVAYFYFSKSDINLGLIEVRLSDFSRKECAGILGILKRTYGNPTLISDGDFLEITAWKSNESGFSVSFMGIVNALDSSYASCDVIYNPIIPSPLPGAEGGF